MLLESTVARGNQPCGGSWREGGFLQAAPYFRKFQGALCHTLHKPSHPVPLGPCSLSLAPIRRCFVYSEEADTHYLLRLPF